MEVKQVAEEAYLHNDHRFLHDVTHASADKFQENVYASFSCFINLDGCLTDSFDTSPYEVDVDF